MNLFLLLNRKNLNLLFIRYEIRTLIHGTTSKSLNKSKMIFSVMCNSMISDDSD